MTVSYTAYIKKRDPYAFIFQLTDTVSLNITNSAFYFCADDLRRRGWVGFCADEFY